MGLESNGRRRHVVYSESRLIDINPWPIIASKPGPNGWAYHLKPWPVVRLDGNMRSCVPVEPRPIVVPCIDGAVQGIVQGWRVSALHTYKQGTVQGWRVSVLHTYRQGTLVTTLPSYQTATSHVRAASREAGPPRNQGGTLQVPFSPQRMNSMNSKREWCT